MNLTSQVTKLFAESDQPLQLLEEVIMQLTEKKFDKLKEVERLVFKHTREALFKERIVSLKTKYPEGKQSEGTLARLEFFSYTSANYKRDEEDLALEQQWASEVDCLDYYNSLIEK
jgi:hypothetical protein